MKSVHLHRQLELTLSMHLFNVNVSHVILFQSLHSKTLDLLVSRISVTVLDTLIIFPIFFSHQINRILIKEI